MNEYINTIDSEWFRPRLTRMAICVAAAVIALMLRLSYLQVIRGAEYRELSLNNSIRLQTLDAPRGVIYDRNGRLLVDNRPSFDLSIHLKDARPLEDTLQKLGSRLALPPDDLMTKIREAGSAAWLKPVQLKRDIGRDNLAAIEARRYELPGIEVGVRLLRYYIEGSSAAHLLGYLGEISPSELKSPQNQNARGGDLIGKFGVEKAFNQHLTGKRGGRQVQVNVNGQVVRVLQTVPAQPGNNLYLTIDWTLQRRAEALLENEAGAVVAMDPSNGEILAFASSPAFDQNEFITGMSRDTWTRLITNTDRPLENKVIQGAYPPASTYKIITAAAGLEEGVIRPDEVIYCPGHYRFGNRTYRCWKRWGHGDVHLVKAIAESCDVYFYQVGQRLGIDRLAWYAKAFGLGTPTGIDLDHEEGGLIPTSSWKLRRFGEPWQPGETLSVAIGQGFNLVTPLQMVTLTAAVANGGTRFRPHIVRRVVSPDHEVISGMEPEVVGQLPISPQTLEWIRKGMWEVVNGNRGTARVAKLKDVDISGKTGTAQVVSRERIEEEDPKAELVRKFKDHAWFVAFAPAERPQIAIAVIVEHGEHGSSTASPIARELVKTYLNLEETPSEADVQASRTSPRAAGGRHDG
ncbi:MAG: penicillin-binding protein 2 [Desulfobacterales bacterium]